ncbi:MAG: YraN family protein [Porticoccaceae bacterium]
MKAQQHGRGADAERAAETFLRRHGLRILARNYRTPRGEIDIIADDGGVLAFVEVRMRSGSVFGGAEESIDRRKRQRIIAAARHFLANGPSAEPLCRFDAMLLTPPAPPAEEGYAVEWLRDAFRADDA